MGRAMAVHRVMTEKADGLQYYRNMTDLPGAVKRVGGALEELRESEITPGELEDYAGGTVTGAERAKLSDLKTLWNGYRELISEQFDDEKTSLDRHREPPGTKRHVGRADLAVYGFDTVRPDLRELIARICEAGEQRIGIPGDGYGEGAGRPDLYPAAGKRGPAGRPRWRKPVSRGGDHAPKGAGGCAKRNWLDRNLFALNPENGRENRGYGGDPVCREHALG